MQKQNKTKQNEMTNMNQNVVARLLLLFFAFFKVSLVFNSHEFIDNNNVMCESEESLTTNTRKSTVSNKTCLKF